MADKDRERAEEELAPKGRGRGRASRMAPRDQGSSEDAQAPSIAIAGLQVTAPRRRNEDAESASRYADVESSIGTLNMMRHTGSLLDDSDSASVTSASSVQTGQSRSSSRSGSTVITRPENFVKKGKDGRILEVTTNYFEVSKECYQTLYQYRVEFQPDEDSTRIKKNLVKKLVPVLGKYIFDGQVIYKTELLDESVVHHSKDDETGREYQITTRIVGLVEPVDPIYLQFYNILLRKCMSLMGLEEMGRNFYDYRKRVEIKEGRLELWPGYATAIRHHERGLFLCAEITHKVLRTSTVLDEITDLYQKLQANPRKCEIIKEELEGEIVMSNYNKKTYRIDDIDFETNPNSLLGGEDGAGTYAEYFFTKYGVKISNLDQPMLVSKPRQRDINKGITNNIYLVPSLCSMTGLSNEMRKNFQLMKRVSENLHVNPTERKRKLDEFMGALRTNPEVQKEFESWHIDFSPTFVKVDARYMGLERIIIDGNQEIVPDYLGDWSNALKGRRLASCKKLQDWVMFAPENDKTNVVRFVEGIRRQGHALGMQVTQPMEISYYDTGKPTNARTLNEVMEKNPRAKMVFFVLPNNQLPRYAAVKKLFLLEWKVPLQCFLSKNIGHKSFNSICSKLMIQVNAKLGGEPWQIKVPLQKLMILGFDVYHCTERRGQSVGALVATISPNLARYYSTVSFHENKSELSSNMCLDTKKCLEAYRQANGELPKRIVLYRDGVGEGQVQFVLDHEVAHIQTALKEMYDGHEIPMLTFIIVTKKINTRALVHDETSHNYTNPAPGTVIDDVITLPERYDFFLVSQSVRQGTVSPTNYNVVYDTSGMSPDRMQRLTYKMCHLYFNWSGTVAVPAPCQYAHKLAYLTGVALNDHAPNELADLLWFL